MVLCGGVEAVQISPWITIHATLRPCGLAASPSFPTGRRQLQLNDAAPGKRPTFRYSTVLFPFSPPLPPPTAAPAWCDQAIWCGKKRRVTASHAPAARRRRAAAAAGPGGRRGPGRRRPGIGRRGAAGLPRAVRIRDRVVELVPASGGPRI